MKTPTNHLLRCALLVASLFAVASANAAEWTAAKQVTSIQVAGGQGSPTAPIAQYFFYTAVGWNASGCPGAKIAYTSSSTAGAKEILAAVMLAQALGKTVTFYGTCQAQDYFVASQAAVNYN